MIYLILNPILILIALSRFEVPEDMIRELRGMGMAQSQAVPTGVLAAHWQPCWSNAGIFLRFFDDLFTSPLQTAHTEDVQL